MKMCFINYELKILNFKKWLATFRLGLNAVIQQKRVNLKLIYAFDIRTSSVYSITGKKSVSCKLDTAPLDISGALFAKIPPIFEKNYENK